MNAITASNAILKAQAQRGDIKKVFNKQNAIVWSLATAVFVAALSIVYVKNVERSLFSQIQIAEQRANKLQVEWGKLLLEQSTLGRPNRVHKVAIKSYTMHVPHSNEVTVVEY